MFSVLLQKINEDIAFSSLETCTEIGSNQTIKLTSNKNQPNRPFSYHTELQTRNSFWFYPATKYGFDWLGLATKMQKYKNVPATCSGQPRSLAGASSPSCLVSASAGARSKFWGVSGSEDRGGGDNSI